jgi:hypothetical protein
MKKVWITALERDDEKTGKLMIMLKQYGLDVNGHFWIDDVGHMAWNTPSDELLKDETALWIVMGSPENFKILSVNYGLSLLAVRIFAGKGQGFPIVVILTANEKDECILPTLLRGAEIYSLSNPSLAAKVVSAANMPAKNIEKDYYLDVHAFAGIGIWFEIGPSQGHEWNGAVFGVHNGDVNFHGTGARGKLPERSVLEYPARGIKIRFDEKEFISWGVRNHLDAGSSYYVRVDGTPDDMLFGPYPDGGSAEAYIITFS